MKVQNLVYGLAAWLLIGCSAEEDFYPQPSPSPLPDSALVKAHSASDCGIQDIYYGVENGLLYVSFSSLCAAPGWEVHNHQYSLSVSGSTYLSPYGAEPGKKYSLGIAPSENVYLCATASSGSSSKSKYYQQFHPSDWTQSYFNPCHYRFGSVSGGLVANSDGYVTIQLSSSGSNTGSRPQHTSGRVWVHSILPGGEVGSLVGDGYFTGTGYITARFDTNNNFNQHFRIRIYSQGCPSYVQAHYLEATYTVIGGPTYWEVTGYYGFGEHNY